MQLLRSIAAGSTISSLRIGSFDLPGKVKRDMRVVADSDWVIDIGPGAGDEGGLVVAEGMPEGVSRSASSRTAPYLAGFLESARRSAVPR